MNFKVFRLFVVLSNNSLNDVVICYISRKITFKLEFFSCQVMKFNQRSHPDSCER